MSYHPADASLNASGALEVHNWIGTAGGYWSDLLLQVLGVGAFPFGAGLLMAGWRALMRKRIIPGFRETLGILSLIASLGTFAHLMASGEAHSFPPGGVVGAVFGGALLSNFAMIGSLIIAGALVMVSLALTVDGILATLGTRGLGVFRRTALEAQAGFVLLQERKAQIKERRVERKTKREEAKREKEEWTLGQIVDEERRDEARVEAEQEAAQERDDVLESARERGRAMGDRRADREEASSMRQAVEDAIDEETIAIPIDLPEEEGFELGCIPGVTEPMVVPRAAETALVPVRTEMDFEEDEAPEVPIRSAAAPEAQEDVPSEALMAQLSAAPVSAPTEEPCVALELLSAEEDENDSTEEPQIVDVRPDTDEEAIEEAIELAECEGTRAHEASVPVEYELPPVSLLEFDGGQRIEVDPERLKDNARKLTKTLENYGIKGVVREIRPGPVVTMYEYVPAPGIKVSKITNLADDLAMVMEALRVRIVAPIPGKGAVGIEIPNDEHEMVFIKELIAHEGFRKSKTNLPIVLGKDIEGNPKIADLAKMPHLLVAGATGSGKSVFVNSLIMSILYKSTPDEVRFIMIDPKMLELSVYNDIPHLLLPVVTDPKKAALALRWAVDEMERRYQKMSELGVRNIDGYNRKVIQAQEQGRKLRLPTTDETLGELCEHMAYNVIIVDELADLMMTAGREVESYIMRLAQKARAAGIHLVLATQRPSVDVLTGVIKANFPTRIAFAVASKHDSRTILDANGAENLLGKGDMLYLSPGIGGVCRVHGAFVNDDEIDHSAAFLKEQGTPSYDESILTAPPEEEGQSDIDEPVDELYDKAIAIVAEAQKVSVSMIQRKLQIGYNRSARIVEKMESEGIVGPPNGSKPREVFLRDLPAN